MLCCMTCSWAPTAGGTTAQSDQRNDGVTAPKTQRLHQRLGRINRTLHADIEKPTPLEQKLIIDKKINFYVFMKNKKILLKKFAFDCWHKTVLWYTTNNTQHNKQYTTQNTLLLYNFLWNIFGRFWRGGLFELDWFRDRRQLNSLLTATEDGCYEVWLKSPPTPPIPGTTLTLTLTGLITASLYCFTFI